MKGSGQVICLYGDNGARARFEAIAPRAPGSLTLLDCAAGEEVQALEAGLRADDIRVIVVDVALASASMEAAVERFLKRAGSGCAVFAVIDGASIASARALLRLGVSEVFEAGEGGAAGLVQALARVCGARPERPALTHAVMGLKGGCGATTLALELAFRSARQLGEPVVRLVDLDLGFGRVAERLGLTAYWPDFDVDSGPSLTGQEAASARHWSGLQVFSAPFLTHSPPSESVVAQALASLRVGADMVVLDTPRSASGLRSIALEQADVLTLVSDTTPSGLELARRTLTALDETAAGAREILVVFNRRPNRGDGAAFDEQAIRKAINYDQLVVLDEDREAFGRGVLLREPVHYSSPQSPFVRGFGNYVDALKSIAKSSARDMKATAQRHRQ